MEAINLNCPVSQIRIALTTEEVARILNAVEANATTYSMEPLLFRKLSRVWESAVLSR